MSDISVDSRHAGLVKFDVWCIGLFLIVSFPTATSLVLSGAAVGQDTWMYSGLPTLSRAVVFVALALLARKVISVMSCPRLLVVSSVMMTAGALAKAASFSWLTGDASAVGSLLSSAALNAGYAVLYVGWMELYSQMDTKHVLVYFTSVHLVSALVSYALFSLGPSFGTVIFIAAMPLVSVIMLRRADARTSDAPYRQGEIQRTDWSISLRPIVLLVAFGFSNAVIRGFLGTEDQATVLLGVCVAALSVLAVAVWRFGEFEITSLYQVSVPILVAGAMLVLMNGEWWGVAAAFCSNAAFALFSVFITAAFCGVAYRYGVNAMWLFGITQASLTFGSLGGKLVSAWGGSFLFDPSMLVATMSVLVVTLVALSMALVSDRDFKTNWGITSRNEQGGRSVVDEEQRLMLSCSRIAQRYGLTRREEEVLVLMMRGYTLSRIGEGLFIAESTMKTHSRHIYRKVGVANRNELQEFVDSWRLKRV
ncbi:helix-turn-helix domain-containing protein [Eggerthella guodeyinii]|nr:helix-turn-helix transcriptional regulator [Eggerthella guodeyinii]